MERQSYEPTTGGGVTMRERDGGFPGPIAFASDVSSTTVDASMQGVSGKVFLGVELGSRILADDLRLVGRTTNKRRSRR